MAFLIKNSNQGRVAGSLGTGQATIQQWIHLKRAAQTLPATTNEVLFQVFGGRVLVHLLLAEVTTVIAATDPISTVEAVRLNDSKALVGTLAVIGTTLDMSSDEVGTIYTVEGDGTAIVSAQLAGFGQIGAAQNPWIMPQGEIYHKTTATKTGALKWDLWYQPLDEGAYVETVQTARVHVT